MNNILVIPNKIKDVDFSVSNEVIKRLVDIGCNVYVEDKYSIGFGNGANVCTEIPECIELIIVIGGDGSVIDASVIAVERDIPVLGINLGKLGYLAEIEISELDRLNEIVDGKARVEEKMLLQLEKAD